jgi:uncharacterized tellurite resistance protein B-like protein
MAAKPSFDELQRIADILMGAAYADGVHQEEEAAAIEKVLQELIEQPTLPAALRQHIAAFDPKSFDVAKACAALGPRTAQERKQLLRLIATVTEIDQIHDFDESDYIIQVAKHIGAEPDEYKGLTMTVEYYDDDLTPPPLPDDADK